MVPQCARKIHYVLTLFPWQTMLYSLQTSNLSPQTLVGKKSTNPPAISELPGRSRQQNAASLSWPFWHDLISYLQYHFDFQSQESRRQFSRRGAAKPLHFEPILIVRSKHHRSSQLGQLMQSVIHHGPWFCRRTSSRGGILDSFQTLKNLEKSKYFPLMSRFLRAEFLLEFLILKSWFAQCLGGYELLMVQAIY